MIDRRDVLKVGAITSLALGLPGSVKAMSPRIDLWVGDSRFARSGFPVPLGVVGTAIDGDTTPLWVATLDVAWRKPGMIVAGETGADALFVLEHLAWGRGRRVVRREELMARQGDRPALIRWLIVPHHPSMIG